MHLVRLTELKKRGMSTGSIEHCRLSANPQEGSHCRPFAAQYNYAVGESLQNVPSDANDRSRCAQETLTVGRIWEECPDCYSNVLPVPVVPTPLTAAMIDSNPQWVHSAVPSSERCDMVQDRTSNVYYYYYNDGNGNRCCSDDFCINNEYNPEFRKSDSSDLAPSSETSLEAKEGYRFMKAACVQDELTCQMELSQSASANTENAFDTEDAQNSWKQSAQASPPIWTSLAIRDYMDLFPEIHLSVPQSQASPSCVASPVSSSTGAACERFQEEFVCPGMASPVMDCDSVRDTDNLLHRLHGSISDYNGETHDFYKFKQRYGLHSPSELESPRKGDVYTQAKDYYLKLIWSYFLRVSATTVDSCNWRDEDVDRQELEELCSIVEKDDGMMELAERPHNPVASTLEQGGREHIMPVPFGVFQEQHLIC